VNRERYATGTPWERVVGYSRAIRTGQFVFVSGTTATGPDGSVVGKDVRPATSMVEVSRLIAPGIPVEIEADPVVPS
jgi:enamine deaminase RidA (YjgF/YER057c/UK114 family)